MDKLDKLQQLVERQIKEKAKIEGKLESLKEDLKNEGFSSVKEAIEHIKKLEAKIETDQKLFDKKLDEFNGKYAQEISKIS